MSKERLGFDAEREMIHLKKIVNKDDSLTISCRFVKYLIEQAERSIELEQENETLRSANEDLLKENHTLKNFKNIDVEHPSNKFF